MQGVVARYDRVGGFGFIAPDDVTQPDFFVCPKFILADKYHRFLIPGQLVEFTPTDVDTKPCAKDVRVIGVTVARQTSGKVVGS